MRQEVKEEVIPIAVKRIRQKKNVEYEDQVCAVHAVGYARTSAAGGVNLYCFGALCQLYILV